jgi:AmmeMemoRadiSam system protein B/AmmeMemoRadiSam system protein A
MPMKPRIAMTVCLAGLGLAAAAPPEPPQERRPAVAGQFYPADRAKLEGAVRAFLADALPKRGERPIAIVSPHAGYIYSGQIAADAFRQVKGHEYDLVVILGANHTTAGFRGVSVYPGGSYRTPLGAVAIDHDTSAKLAAADAAFTFRPEVHRDEHSIEVQIPFVQVVLPDVPIVAAVVGSTDLDLIARFGKALAAVLQDRRALIVASSDLSHYPAYDDALAADRATLEGMASLDTRKLTAAVSGQLARGRKGLSTCACGLAPVLAAMEAARHLGATRGIVLSYANSGDTVLARRSRVVGYGAMLFTAGDRGTDLAGLPQIGEPAARDPLSAADRQALLELARKSIGQFMETETAPLPRGFGPAARRRQGVFVTLKKGGELRGCIGHIPPDLPVSQAVAKVALQAAFADRRFPELRPDELAGVEIQISLLSPLKPVSGPGEIVIGRDGVQIVKDGRAAIYLPEVPVEQEWNVEETLEHLCRKAGLAPGSWRSGARLFTYTTETFSESDES